MMSDGLIIGLATLISTSIVGPIVKFLIDRTEKKIVAKVDVLHKEINGRMGEMLAEAKKASKAEGKEEQRKENI